MHPVHGARKLSRDTVSMVGDMLPLLDFASVLLAAYFAVLFFAPWVPAGIAMPITQGIGMTALAMAILAPLILCDRAFVRFASSAQTAAMLRCYLVRFALFVSVLLVVGTATRMLAGLPMALLALWATAIFVLTALSRAMMVAMLRRLERRGVLTESVAVVGSGHVVSALMAELATLRPGRVELVGVFADPAPTGVPCPGVGTIADLLEVGKHRNLDWILIAMPTLSSDEIRPVVQRLKTLSVPIAAWAGDTPREDLSSHAALSVGQPALPSASSVSEEAHLWPMLVRSGAGVRRWFVTLFLALREQAVSLTGWGRRRRSRTRGLQLHLDDHDLDQFLPLARAFGQRQFGYVVTPNADHLMRLHRDGDFRKLYASARFVLLDSRFVAGLLRMGRGLRLGVCPGSDLTEALLEGVVEGTDRVVLIGGSAQQADLLRNRYDLQELAHYDPPMGFVHQPEAFEACLGYIESQSPFRFCLLAVGCPQQELLAFHLGERGIARGLALCVGASVNFLTGVERRAPRAMQHMGMEWLFRLLQSPRRMAHRYLVQAPRLFSVLHDTDILLRTTSAPVAHAVVPHRLTGFRRPYRTRSVLIDPEGTLLQLRERPIGRAAPLARRSAARATLAP